MRLVLLLPLISGCVIYDGGGDPDPELGDTAVIGAGWTNGGWDGALDLAGDELTLTLTPLNTDPPSQLRTGRLTASGAAELAAIDRDLASATLAETYGCPGCDDGRASRVDIVRGDLVTRTIYEGDAPPAALIAADAFLLDVMDALQSCTASTRVVADDCLTP